MKLGEAMYKQSSASEAADCVRRGQEVDLSQFLIKPGQKNMATDTKPATGRQTAPASSDYYALIVRAVSGADTDKARRAIYDIARNALLAQLRKIEPPLSEAEVTRERNALEQAIERIEREVGKSRLKETALHRNPFWLLGATTRDDRRRIVELAEQRLLERDNDIYQKARSDLTNPRTRLAAEVGWLPGVSPKKATYLAQHVLLDPHSVWQEAGLPTLAHANLMAAAFEAIDASADLNRIAGFIKEFSHLVEKLSAEDILRDINEDRAVSGFPEVKAVDQLEAELGDQKRNFRGSIKGALDRLPTPVLVDVMTNIVTDITAGGKQHGSELIDTLVDSYELEAQNFFQNETENIQKIIETVRNSAKTGETAASAMIDKLSMVAHNWNKVARPIQLNAKARGTRHNASVALALSIRQLSVDLFNEHKMLEQSKRLTELLHELFVDVPELSERVSEDRSAIENLAKEIKKSEAELREWEREITYEADVGALSKSKLSVSPKGISWKGQTFPLESITRVRWGGLRHSYNGIPTGTNYTVAFGDVRSEAVIALRRQEIFTNFIDKLWRAVGVRLLIELLQTLKSGKELQFGPATIKDDGVTLPVHRLWGSVQEVRFTWFEVHVWTAEGSFYIGAKENKKAYAALPYIQMANVHVLEHAIRMAFKKSGMRVLSDVLAPQ